MVLLFFGHPVLNCSLTWTNPPLKTNAMSFCENTKRSKLGTFSLLFSFLNVPMLGLPNALFVLQVNKIPEEVIFDHLHETAYQVGTVPTFLATVPSAPFQYIFLYLKRAGNGTWLHHPWPTRKH